MDVLYIKQDGLFYKDLGSRLFQTSNLDANAENAHDPRINKSYKPFSLKLVM